MKNSMTKRISVLPIIMLMLCVLSHSVTASGELNALCEAKEVYPGGIPFGVKLYNEGLLVVGFSDVECENGKSRPAADAGIKVGDILTKINGEKIISAEVFTEKVGASGEEITITYIRDGCEQTVNITPSLSSKDGKYKTGMWLRDSTAGIGTVTFIECETGEFAGLGHGICDADTGELIPLMRGIVTDVKISGVKIGIPGTPGELKGYFTTPNCGVILKNTNSGVFGIYNNIPGAASDSGTVEVGKKNEVHTGEAHIICTVDGGEKSKYSIEITRLPEKGGSNFEICVTDQKLIEKTGGIVQGMSGSPIIQDGKLVGAVTHVLINDPTKGYGIFIENMLEAAE